MSVKVNDLFHDGHNYFQVVAVTAKTATVRPIKSKKVRDVQVRTAFDYDIIMKPLRNEFTTSWLFNDKQNESGKRCKIHQFNIDHDKPAQIKLSNAFNVWAYQLTEGDEVIIEHDLG